MKLAILVGTRPEIVKMAPIMRAADELGVEYAVVHTGQHYSFEMDGIFFDELKLRQPDVNLGVGSGSHPFQLAAMIGGLESALLEVDPDIVLVEGDTNSVLAAAITGNKLGMRVGHVEAGLRSGDRGMPEEINRILVDHLGDLLFAPTDGALTNLLQEGIPPGRIAVTGNTVVDEVLRHRDDAARRRMPQQLGVLPGQYMLATAHRAENVGDPARLAGILDGLARCARGHRLPILLALHPRTAGQIDAMGLRIDPSLRALPALGYLEFLSLHLGAALVLTDSGGLQEEACTLGVPSVVLRDTTERPEAVEVGASLLAGADADAIEAAAAAMLSANRGWRNPFGDGQSGRRIMERLDPGFQATTMPMPVPIPVIGAPVSIPVEEPALRPPA
jgi:UDP-N-acetylglucosamine 2-epimerase (non-hydrolysing)